MSRSRPEPEPGREGPDGVAQAVLLSLLVLLGMAVVIIGVLLSQFGTVRGGPSSLRPLDEALTGSDGGLGAPWQGIRGDWARTPDGATVTRPGDRLSVAVRPVGGIDGVVEVEGPATVDGWSVVWRWEDPGSYGLVVLEPEEGSISLVAVVSDRSRLIAQAPLPDAAEDGARTVAVELAGPVVKVRVDGEVAVAGRDDRLTDGDRAGIGVVGDADGARFSAFRTRPPGPAEVHEVAPGGSR